MAFFNIDFCLLIPCYNNTAGLLASLETVNYRPNHFLVLVVDDGSSVPVDERAVHEKLGPAFPVVILRSGANEGITKALNKGLQWIITQTNARFVARLDCGDRCHADRFYQQVDCLDANVRIGLVGTWCRFEERETGRGYVYKTPVSHDGIVRAMHFRNVFIHPAVMFRVTLIKELGFYPEGFEYAEDYAYFWKMIGLQKSAILNSVLVTCELNPLGISSVNRAKQLAARWRVVKTFAPNQILRILAFIRLKTLRIVPNAFLLRLKKMRG
jgi:glycosyltransferase involved in cell wall biosynthesis